MTMPEVFCYHRCIDCGRTAMVAPKESPPPGWQYDADSEQETSDVCPDCAPTHSFPVDDEYCCGMKGDTCPHCPSFT